MPSIHTLKIINVSHYKQACYQYFGETLNAEDTKANTSLQQGQEQRNNQTNSRKFKAVVTEMEALLGEFKCLMDGCLDINSITTEVDKKVQNPNNNPDNIVNGDSIPNVKLQSDKLQKDTDAVVSLSPELARAYDKSLDTRWKIKEQANINPLYQQYFSFSNEDQERR